MEQLLSERAIVRRDYAILPREGLCDSPLPNYQDAKVYILAAPVIGANFTEYLIDFNPGGRMINPVEDDLQYFIFGLKGTATLEVATKTYQVNPGDFAYLPPDVSCRLLNTAEEISSVIMLKKPYTSYGIEKPYFIIKNEGSIAGEVYMGLEGVNLKALLPPNPAFDIAMNIFTFQSGTSLPVIETHIMQHGIYVLQGKGLYYLGDRWHQIQKDDYIWLNNYTPQSFYCTGQIATRYLYYKDINRDVTF